MPARRAFGRKVRPASDLYVEYPGSCFLCTEGGSNPALIHAASITSLIAGRILSIRLCDEHLNPLTVAESRAHGLAAIRDELTARLAGGTK